jgi:hypothetical protein
MYLRQTVLFRIPLMHFPMGSMFMGGVKRRLSLIWKLWIHLRGKLRRFYLVHFRMGYVERKLALREGSCRQCSSCCMLLFRCPMLDEQGLCRIYNKLRWKVCRLFPVDERDVTEVGLVGGRCGYSFGPGRTTVLHSEVLQRSWEGHEKPSVTARPECHPKSRDHLGNHGESPAVR